MKNNSLYTKANMKQLKFKDMGNDYVRCKGIILKSL